MSAVLNKFVAAANKAIIIIMVSLSFFLLPFFIAQDGLSKEELGNLDTVLKETYKAKYPIIGHMLFKRVDMNSPPLYRVDL